MKKRIVRVIEVMAGAFFIGLLIFWFSANTPKNTNDPLKADWPWQQK